MLSDDELDEYVTQILLNDAKKQKSSYSTLGFRAFLNNTGKDGPVGKPNTRFLRNIVRDVDNHNAALARKEERESRLKLSELSRSNSSSERRGRGRSRSRSPERRRSRSPRRRGEHRRPRDHASDDERRESRRHRQSHSRHEDSRDEDDRSRRRKRHRRRDEESDEERHRRRTSKDRSHRRHDQTRSKRTDSKENDRKRRHRRHHLPSSRSLSPHRTKRHRTPNPEEHTPHHPQDSSSRRSSIGPDQPISGPEYIRIKGRGTTSSRPNPLDLKFSPSYDPRIDTQAIPSPSPEPQDDWGIALRALRARQEHILSSAMTSRLEETKTEIQTGWPTYSKGEREWDKGKVILEDGSVGVNVWGVNKPL